VAGVLGRARDVRAGESRRRGLRRQAQAVRPGHVPLPLGRRAARGASRRLHRHRHRLPIQEDEGLQRPPSDGVRCVRPAGRAVCRRARRAPARDHGGQHRQHRAPDQDVRLQLRLVPTAGHDGRGILPLDAVDIPEAVRQLVRSGRERRQAHRGPRHQAQQRPVHGHPDRSARAQPGPRHRRPDRRAGRADALPRAAPRAAPGGDRLPASGLPVGGAGQLVPEARHGAGQRGGHQRGALRSRGPPGLPAGLDPVDASDHGLRRSAAGGHRPGRLARVDQDHAAQLDRAERRGGRGLCRGRVRRDHPRLHHAPGHAVRRDVHGPGPRTPAGGGRHDARAAAGRRRLRRPGRPEKRTGTDGRHQGQDRRGHGRLCDKPRQRREDPDMGGRLRDDGLRHGRDHGGAGPRHAGLRVRRDVRPADRQGRRAARRRGLARLRRGRHGGQLRPVRRAAQRRRTIRRARRPPRWASWPTGQSRPARYAASRPDAN